MNLQAQLRERNCPACGSTDRSGRLHSANFNEQSLDEFAFASRKMPELMHLSLVRCSTCSLVYASPAFSAEFLASAYRQAGYDSGSEAHFAARTYAALLPAIVRRLPRAGSALEIGAGNGAFLAELKNNGFSDLCGVEPSIAAASGAGPDVSGLIRLGVFNARDFQPQSLDLVACFQTLEHVEDPLGLCRAAASLLRPGGALYLVVHDFESWVTRILGRKSPIFDIEHQQLFSRQSISFLLKAAGFHRVEVSTINNRYPLSYWLRLTPLPTPIKTALLGALKRAGVGGAPITVNIGNLAVVAYKEAAATTPSCQSRESESENAPSIEVTHG